MQVNSAGKLWPAKLTHMDPPVLCPNCKTAVQGFAGGQSVSASSSIMRMAYTLYPCYCEVDQYWASGLSEEMGRREQGLKPRAVEGLSVIKRADRTKQIQSQLTMLYTKRDAAVVANMPAKKAGYEREIVQLVTELARITPGAHNTVPPIVLEPEVVQWAGQQGMDMPPGNEVEPPITVQITLVSLHRHLCADADYAERHTAQKLLAIAQRMYGEIGEYARTGKPVAHDTMIIAAKLIPNAEGYLKAKEATGPICDVTPEEEFATMLSRRRLRRLEILDNQS